ncbi:MAG TPA: GntR family transcriptional regulator [Solirubrobacteraceae bacterium]|jgi:DNA-binding transcriptional regulator YhcF (GntR family)|nr:GntR family transcriptional regulator [Solirubrobacteraceae bacterium]
MARRDHPDSYASEAATETLASEPLVSGQPPAAQLELEDLTIDRAGEIPIGVQLAWALRARIGDGRLAPGRRLPGLRELAEMLGINANTARSVYQRLEQEGLIDSRQGTGTFVASVAQEPSAVGQIAADAARQARRTGVDPREVAAALYVTAEPASDEATQAGERRRELRAQIAALEQTLSEIQSSHPGLIPAPSKPSRHAGPRLLSVEELERVRMELVRRIAAAEPLFQTPADKRNAVAAERQSVSDAEPRATPSKPAQERRAPRTRPRTRPSTA